MKYFDKQLSGELPSTDFKGINREFADYRHAHKSPLTFTGSRGKRDALREAILRSRSRVTPH